jgi:hypothetical protein
MILVIFWLNKVIEMNLTLSIGNWLHNPYMFANLFANRILLLFQSIFFRKIELSKFFRFMSDEFYAVVRGRTPGIYRSWTEFRDQVE